MKQTLTIINGENLFAYYPKIFTLKSLWDLMERNNVPRLMIIDAKKLVCGIIGRDYSDQVFTRIKNYGNFIVDKNLCHAFSDDIYNCFVKGADSEELRKSDFINSYTEESVKKVLQENTKELTMLDYKTFLKGKFTSFENKFEDLKKLLESDKENICIPAYYLAIYNTYITGRVLDTAVGKYARELMADNKNTYYTSAKIIYLLNNDEKEKKTVKKNGEGTLLCGEDDFWKAAEKFAGNHPKNITAKEFNDIQMQKICWTAYSLDITETCTKNELLYILLNIDSNFVRNSITAEKLKEHKEKLENELKPLFPLYVV